MRRRIDFRWERQWKRQGSNAPLKALFEQPRADGTNRCIDEGSLAEMNELLNIRRNVTASVVAFSANLILVFVSYRLLVLVGGLEALGLWSALMAWVFVVRIGDVGMAVATTRFIAGCDAARESGRIRSYVDSALAVNGLLFLVLSLVGYALLSSQMHHIVQGDREIQAEARALLPLILSGFLLSNLSGVVLGALTGIHHGYQSSFISVAGTIAQLLIVLLLVPRIGLAGLAWGQLIQHALTTVVGWVIFRRALGLMSGQPSSWIPSRLSREAVNEMVGFSLRAQALNFANGFFEPLSKILMGRIFGLETLGLYEMAYKMVTVPRNAVVAGALATQPALTRLMELDRPGARMLYDRTLRTLMRSSAAVLMVVVLASPLVGPFWFDTRAVTLPIFVALLAVGFVVNSIGAPAYILGIAVGRMGANFHSAVMSLVLIGVAAVLASIVESPTALVAGVAVSLCAGALYIRWKNEFLLRAAA